MSNLHQHYPLERVWYDSCWFLHANRYGNDRLSMNDRCLLFHETRRERRPRASRFQTGQVLASNFIFGSRYCKRSYRTVFLESKADKFKLIPALWRGVVVLCAPSTSIKETSPPVEFPYFHPRRELRLLIKEFVYSLQRGKLNIRCLIYKRSLILELHN